MITQFAIKSPAPSTTSFIVSQGLPDATPSSFFLFYVAVAFRILFACSVLLVELSQFRHLFNGIYDLSDSTLWTRFPGSAACAVADALDWRVSVGLAVLILYFLSRRNYAGTSEKTWLFH